MSITVKEMQVSIGKKIIIRNINLECDKGQIVALLGLNGAGKTTLIKSIAGLIRPDKGTVLVHEEEINKLSIKERAKYVTYVPQQLSTSLDYTVEDFVLMGVTPYLGAFESPKKVHKEKVSQALKDLELSHLRGKGLTTLSGGEKQMVYLARAIVQQAKVMVLDEPTAYLDFKRQHTFLGQLSEFVRKSEKTVLLSVHDPNLALQYADKIVIVYNETTLMSLEKSGEGWGEKMQEALDLLYDGKAQLVNNRGNSIVVYQQ